MIIVVIVTEVTITDVNERVGFGSSFPGHSGRSRPLGWISGTRVSAPLVFKPR